MPDIQKKTPRGKGRPWVALFTSLLMDTDLVLAGHDVRGLYPYLLLHSAEQGLNGMLPADPRKIQLFAHLDGGLPAVKAALDTLVDIDKLTRTDDEHLYIRTWDVYQRDWSNSETKPATSSKSALLRWHNVGKHDADQKGPQEGCALCGDTTPGGAPEQPDSPAAPFSNLPTVRDIKQKVWDRCGQLVAIAEEDGTDVLEAYLTAYETAEQAGVTYADVKGVGAATLLDTVVDHAAARFLNATDKATLDLLHGIRRDHGTDVLWKMSDPSVANAQKPVAYLRGCYKTDSSSA